MTVYAPAGSGLAFTVPQSAGNIGTYGWQGCCGDYINTNTFTTLTLGNLYLGIPNYAHETYTIDQIGCYSNPVAGAQVRGGLYILTNQSKPYDITFGSPWANLASDGGPQPATGSGPIPFTSLL